MDTIWCASRQRQLFHGDLRCRRERLHLHLQRTICDRGCGSLVVFIEFDDQQVSYILFRYRYGSSMKHLSLTVWSQYSTTLVTSSSTSSAAPSSTTVLTISEPSPSATASSSPPQSTDSGLPIGAKIAIGSICGVVGIILILLGTCCILRKRKRSKAASEPQFVHAEAEKAPALKTDGGASGGHMAQMSELHDVPVKRSRAELP